MPVDTIQVNYEELEQLCQRFAKCAQQVQNLSMQVNQKVCRLREGSWSGRGANAFYEEMDDYVYPGIRRLQDALCEANSCACKCSETYSQAEQEAAALFKDGDGAGGGVGSSGGGAVGAGGGGGAGSGQDGWSTSGKYGPMQFDASGNPMPTGLQFKTGLKTDWTEIGRRTVLFGEKRGRPPTNDDSIKLKIPLWEYRTWGQEYRQGYKLGGMNLINYKESVQAGTVEGGIGFDGKSGVIGGYVEGTGAQAEAGYAWFGPDFGPAARARVKALSGEVFLGYRNGSIGAVAGWKLASVEVTEGFNIAGWNIGVTAEAGIKAEIGVKLGKSNRVMFGPWTIGLDFGEAIGQ